MMGQLNHDQGEFFYSFRLDEAIPDDHPAIKRILRLGRLRLGGPRGAQDEFTLGAIAQNLRRLAKLVARPPPAAALCPA